MLTTDTADWRTQAACRGMSTEAFYPPEDATLGEAAAVSKAAIKVCAGCPVRDLCLKDADEYGVWGGTTQSQRRKGNVLSRASQDEEIVRRYRANESLRDLGAAFKLNPTTIGKRLKGMSEPMRRPGQQSSAAS